MTSRRPQAARTNIPIHPNLINSINRKTTSTPFAHVAAQMLKWTGRRHIKRRTADTPTTTQRNVKSKTLPRMIADLSHGSTGELRLVKQASARAIM